MSAIGLLRGALAEFIAEVLIGIVPGPNGAWRRALEVVRDG